MKLVLGIASTLLLSACASSYKPYKRDSLDLQKSGAGSEVEVAYKHNVLSETGNFKYDTKARMHGVDVVAVKIKNNSGRAINTRDDLDFFVGGTEVTPSNARTAMLPVRQRTGLYFLYLLMSPVMLFKSELKCNSNGFCEQDTQYFPIGLIVGGLLTAINAGVSASSNGAVAKEITGNDLYGKNLQPGEEASGYLIFRDAGSAPVSARLKGAAAPAPPPATTTTPGTPPTVKTPEDESASPKDFR